MKEYMEYIPNVYIITKFQRDKITICNFENKRHIINNKILQKIRYNERIYGIHSKCLHNYEIPTRQNNNM
jgi:hypothetical protein